METVVPLIFIYFFIYTFLICATLIQNNHIYYTLYH